MTPEKTEKNNYYWLFFHNSQHTMVRKPVGLYIIVLSCGIAVLEYLVVASFSPFFQSQTTMEWLSSSPTDTSFFPSPV